jgi:hypothetical protein
MRAGIVDREEASAHVEQGDPLSGDGEGLPGPGRDIPGCRDGVALGHGEPQCAVSGARLQNPTLRPSSSW